MARQDIIIALRNGIERGETLEEAKQTLLNAGYSSGDVEEAASEIEKLKVKEKMPKPGKFPPLPQPPKA